MFPPALHIGDDPMRKTLATGQTCVGDLRLAPIDVGFDLRLHGIEVKLPDHFGSVGIEDAGDVYLVKGTKEEMVAAIVAAGYRVKDDS
jgi:hypothetical protein